MCDCSMGFQMQLSAIAVVALAVPALLSGIAAQFDKEPDLMTMTAPSNGRMLLQTSSFFRRKEQQVEETSKAVLASSSFKANSSRAHDAEGGSQVPRVKGNSSRLLVLASKQVTTSWPSSTQSTARSVTSMLSIAEIRSSFVYMVFVIACAYIYSACGFRKQAPRDDNSEVKVPARAASDSETFHFAVFDSDGCCGRDSKICFTSFCCMGIRWADTLSYYHVQLGIGFWTLLLIHTLCMGLDMITCDVSGAIFVVFAVCCRQKLRAACRLKHGTMSTCIADCILWSFCCPCAAAQEAREVEYFPPHLSA